MQSRYSQMWRIHNDADCICSFCYLFIVTKVKINKGSAVKCAQVSDLLPSMCEKVLIEVTGPYFLLHTWLSYVIVCWWHFFLFLISHSWLFPVSLWYTGMSFSLIWSYVVRNSKHSSSPFYFFFVLLFVWSHTINTQVKIAVIYSSEASSYNKTQNRRRISSQMAENSGDERAETVKCTEVTDTRMW